MYRNIIMTPLINVFMTNNNDSIYNNVYSLKYKSTKNIVVVNIIHNVCNVK